MVHEIWQCIPVCVNSVKSSFGIGQVVQAPAETETDAKISMGCQCLTRHKDYAVGWLFGLQGMMLFTPRTAQMVK